MKFNTDVFKPSWYKEQMSGWSKQSYVLLIIALSFLTGVTLGGSITVVAIASLIAGLIGFTCTLAITNARPINGVLGLVSAIIYIFVAIHGHNPSDAVMQGVYVVLLDIPVLLIPGWAKDVQKKVRKMSETANPQVWLTLTAIIFAVAWGALYLMDTNVFISTRPVIDSLTAAIGVTGAVLTTLRFSDSYYFWIAQGVSQIVLWGVTFAQGESTIIMMMVYILYLSNDAIALTHSPWFKKELRK